MSVPIANSLLRLGVLARVGCFSAFVLAVACSSPTTVWGQAEAEEPAAEEPAPAPKPGVPTAYKSLRVAETLRDDYRDKDPDPATARENDKKHRDTRSRLRKLVSDIQKDERGDTIKVAKDAADFDNYYTQFILAQMTQPERATEFAEDRRMFFYRHIIPIKSAEVHDRLVNLTLATMLEVAKSNEYHPAARYNAMLIIGELNASEAVRGGSNPAPPEPLRAALAEMLKLFKNPDQPDIVKVACLVGILRHAELDGQKLDLEQRWAPNIKLAVLDPLLALLNTKDPPKGRTVEGHRWMQRRALDIMGALGDAGTDGIVAKKCEEIIGDEDAHMSLRCTAAVTLGKIGSLVAAKFDPTVSEERLGQLAVQAARDELARLEDEKKQRDELLKPFLEDGSGGAMRGPGGMRGRVPGMMPGMPGMMPGMRPPGGAIRPGSGAARPQPRSTAPAMPMPPAPSSGARVPSMPGMPGMPGGYPGAGGMGMGGANDLESFTADLAYREKYKVEVSCKRLRYELACVKASVEGIPARAKSGLKNQFDKDPHKAYLERLVAKIDEVSKLIEKSDLELDTLIKDLRKAAVELDAVARTAPAGAKPAEPAPGEPAADGPDGPDGSPAPARSATKPAAPADPVDGPAAPAK